MSRQWQLAVGRHHHSRFKSISACDHNFWLVPNAFWLEKVGSSSWRLADSAIQSSKLKVQGLIMAVIKLLPLDKEVACPEEQTGGPACRQAGLTMLAATAIQGSKVILSTTIIFAFWPMPFGSRKSAVAVGGRQ